MKIPVEAEEITKEASGDNEDQYEDASAHPEVNKDKGKKQIDHPEVYADLDADTSEWIS